MNESLQSYRRTVALRCINFLSTLLSQNPRLRPRRIIMIANWSEPVLSDVGAPVMDFQRNFHSQLVCYQCDDCELQQEIPVVCGDITFPTTSPTDPTCPTCAPEPTPPTTPEWTTSTPDTTCPTCAPTLPTTPIPTTSTPEETTCPTCAPTLPTSPYPTTSTPEETTCPTCAPTLPTSPYPTTSTPEETTCPTCAPTLPTSPYPTTSTPQPTTPIPTTPSPPTTPIPTTPSPPTTPIPTTPSPPTTPYCPAGCCPCSGSRSTSVFALAARATKQALMDEFEEDLRSARQLPLPVYVCFTTERYVNNRRVVSRGCTKRQQSLSDTCTLLAGGQVYEQCSLCSWQLCNR
uniref:Uncharacterized protein n=1 Tax=Anopheles farauti TaxID=69004 RepID=A0A182QF85_9DIPT